MTAAAALLAFVALLLAACLVDVASATVFGRPGQAGWFLSPVSFHSTKTTTTATTATLLEKMRGGASKKKKTEERSSAQEETAAAVEAVDLYLPGLLEATVARTNKVGFALLIATSSHSFSDRT